jgi:hypothetical protein
MPTSSRKQPPAPTFSPVCATSRSELPAACGRRALTVQVAAGDGRVDRPGFPAADRHDREATRLGMIVFVPAPISNTGPSSARSAIGSGPAWPRSAGSPASAHRAGREPNEAVAWATSGCPAGPAMTSSGRPRSTSRRTISGTTGLASGPPGHVRFNPRNVPAPGKSQNCGVCRYCATGRQSICDWARRSSRATCPGRASPSPGHAASTAPCARSARSASTA